MTVYEPPVQPDAQPVALGLDRLTRPGLTPAGLQSRAVLKRRRIIFVLLNAATYGGLLAWLGTILSSGGWTAIDAAIFICFALAAPWGVLGIWNALIGLWLLHGPGDALASVAPYAAASDSDTPVTARTAIVMTICNEAPERALARLESVRQSLGRTSAPHIYSYFVLSDTIDPQIAAIEAIAVERWRATAGPAAHIHYRRRSENSGFKAGNLRDFCERWGDDFEFFVPLDADSVMSGALIEKMVRIGQAWPRIGILQSLAVGAPSDSLFARVFQFGMRQGMRPYTMGSAWWNGDCGPFWGHNALVRMRPFRDLCHLPELPGGKRILSHDQIEAVQMRGAGYEVRVLPVEGGSYEDNPPHVLEFMRRDTRWCQGNLQYVHLLGMKGIEPTSRFQLIWAIMMFAGLPAWTAIIALAAFKPFDSDIAMGFPVGSAIAFYVFFLVMFLAPKLAGYLDIAMTRGELARYGGGLRFFAGAATEIVFSFLLAALVTFRTSVFMIGVLFGKTIGWGGQMRDAQAIDGRTAFAALWPQLAFGLALFAVAAVSAPALIAWSLPLTLGYIAGVPFAMLTAWPAAGRWARATGLCAIPEDYAPPPELAVVAAVGPESPPVAGDVALAG